MSDDSVRHTDPIPSISSGLNSTLMKQYHDVLLVIFIHGFKGTETTFGIFPERLQHILSESILLTTVECIVFPAYETKGNLVEAVEQFADWLTTLTVEREVVSGGGAGTVKIVLCGHSMGGLLAADILREFINSRPDQTAPLWPRIIACIAFDTPYFGVHPHVFKNSATKAAEYANTARSVASGVLGSVAGWSTKKASVPATDKAPAAATTVPISDGSSSPWNKWVPAAYAVGGALLAGTAAGAAYYKRENLSLGYTWATDHMKFIGNLWDENALKRRMDDLIDTCERMNIVFRAFYTFLQPSPPAYLSARTFIILPPKSSRSFSKFLPARNGLAPDELHAHTGMFDASTNDGYHELELVTAGIIREALTFERRL